MAELVDALVSNTSGFTSMPVRSRLWVLKLKSGSVQKTCGYVKSDQVLNNVHAIWVAEIKENKVNLWHIHPDTKENRNKFGI